MDNRYPNESLDNGATPSGVFGARRDRAAVVGHIPCPSCGYRIPFTLSQVGRDVDCPQCGSRSLRVGDSLIENTTHAPLQAPTLVVMSKPPRSGLTLKSLSMTVCAIVAFGGAIVLTSAGAGRGRLGWSSVAVREGKMPVGTAEIETSNLKADAPEITLEAINALLEQENLQAALVQAQVWQQMLRDFGAAEDDQRLIRLEQVIEKLSVKLAPAPVPPPAFFEQFRRAMADLRKALMAEDVPAATRALGTAEGLFTSHPDELEPYGASLLSLKQRYSQMELLYTGRERIRKLLVQAEEDIRREKPTEAAENIAEAMFLALRVPMSDEEFTERSQTVQRLERELRFARGKRAIEEAKRCHDLNDLEARNQQLREAFELLPDLPAERVEDLIVSGNELSGLPIANPRESELGRELVFRDAYEEALRFYGQLEMLTELADRCVEAYRLHELATTLDEASAERVGKLILEAMEFEVGDLLSRSSRSEQVTIGLAKARSALDRVSPWRSTTQWRFIDSSLKSKGDDVASIAIEEGRKLAAANDLAGAVRLVEPAAEIAGPDVRSQAEALLVGWRRGLAIQLREIAEAEHWKSIGELRYANVLDAWSELQRFQQEYPDSRRNIAAARKALEPMVSAAIDRDFVTIEKHENHEQWREYRAVAKRLAAAPLVADDQLRLKAIEAKLQVLDGEAEKRYRATYELRRSYKGSRAVMAELIKELPQVLELNPDHKDAEQILDEVKTIASSHAAAMMIDAKTKMRLKNKSLVVSILNQIVALDPGGDYGSEARKMLKQIADETSS